MLILFISEVLKPKYRFSFEIKECTVTIYSKYMHPKYPVVIYRFKRTFLSFKYLNI